MILPRTFGPFIFQLRKRRKHGDGGGDGGSGVGDAVPHPTARVEI